MVKYLFFQDPRFKHKIEYVYERYVEKEYSISTPFQQVTLLGSCNVTL